MKKGSLELSINAIVILIIAITLLGLGLGFIKKMFGSAQDQFTDVEAGIENQMFEEMQQSGKLVTLNKKEIELNVGKEMDFYYGIRNTGAAAVFYMQWRCESALGGGGCPTGNARNNWPWFNTFVMRRVNQQESVALSVNILAANTIKERYRGQFIVWRCFNKTATPNLDTACPKDICFKADGSLPTGRGTNCGSQTAFTWTQLNITKYESIDINVIVN